MPVFPVTKIWSIGTFSRIRFWRLCQVGARLKLAMQVISCRFNSSGNGVRVEPVLKPASTWITGMRRWNDASAAAKAELVSPWTITAIGY